MSDLEGAYRATRYVAFDGPRRLVARVGERSREFDGLLWRHGATGGAFITAWNPRSVPTPDAENRRAGARLAADLAARGYQTLPHRGEGDESSWPPEEGLFVLGLHRPDAVAVAARYRQNAVVVIEIGAPAALVWVT